MNMSTPNVTTPVLTVSGDGETTPRRRRILVAVQFTGDAGTLIHYAADMARREQAAVCLLHVIDSGSFASGLAESPLCKTPEHEAKAAHRYLRLLAQRGLPPEVPVTVLVQPGRAAREIVKAAERICADLILLASPRQNWLSRWFSGDPTRWVEAHAACSVVVLREPSYGPCDCMNGFEIGRAAAFPPGIIPEN